MSDDNMALAITEDHQMSPASQLKDRQRTAISMLVAGYTQTEVASTIGVARETVTRWSNRNPYFQSELSQRRWDVWEYRQNRLRNLSLKALDVLEMALMKGDVRVALALLKRSEMEPPPSPSSTPDEVIDNNVSRDLQNLMTQCITSPEHKELRGLMHELWMPESSEVKEGSTD